LALAIAPPINPKTANTNIKNPHNGIIPSARAASPPAKLPAPPDSPPIVKLTIPTITPTTPPIIHKTIAPVVIIISSFYF